MRHGIFQVKHFRSALSLEEYELFICTTIESFQSIVQQFLVVVNIASSDFVVQLFNTTSLPIEYHIRQKRTVKYS